MFNYDEIRPYNDDEVHDVLAELVKDNIFQQGLHHFLPNFTLKKLKEVAKSIDSIYTFQRKVTLHFAKAIIDNTITNLTFSGFEGLRADKKYLFISNHRDIVMDAAILNYLLYANGLDTSQIAIGNNLDFHPTVTAAMRLNKTFYVHRNVAPKNLYQYSLRLSHYIREKITTGQDGIWIAQRQGRAKDGNDMTQPALLKMFNLSGKGTIIDNFRELNIMPVSISYEYDPCVVLKAGVAYEKLVNPNYKKKEGDDFKHIIAGVKGKKGNVHIHFGTLSEKALKETNIIKNKNKKFQHLAKSIDCVIHQNYELWNTNLIAKKLLENEDIDSAVQQEILATFYDYHPIFKGNKVNDKKTTFFKKFILESYANPVYNRGFD